MRATSKTVTEARGPEISVSAEGSQLVVEGPEHLLTTEFLAELVARKPAIFRLLSLRREQLYCETSRSKVPPEMQQTLASRKEEITVIPRRGEEQRKRQWLITPHGPATFWGFLPGGRIGVVLKSDIDTCPKGSRQIRFMKASDTRPVESVQELEQKLPEAPPAQNTRRTDKTFEEDI